MNIQGFLKISINLVCNKFSYDKNNIILFEHVSVDCLFVFVLNEKMRMFYFFFCYFIFLNGGTHLVG